MDSRHGIHKHITAPTGRHKRYKLREYPLPLTPHTHTHTHARHLFRFKDPFARAVFLDPVPPAESDQEATRHVFDGPEVEGEEEDDRDEQLHERVGEEEGEDQVHHQRSGAEEDVKEGRNRMPVCVYW